MNSPLLDVSHLTVSFDTDEGLITAVEAIAGDPGVVTKTQLLGLGSRVVFRLDPLKSHFVIAGWVPLEKCADQR